MYTYTHHEHGHKVICSILDGDEHMIVSCYCGFRNEVEIVPLSELQEDGILTQIPTGIHVDEDELRIMCEGLSQLLLFYKDRPQWMRTSSRHSKE